MLLPVRMVICFSHSFSFYVASIHSIPMLLTVYHRLYPRSYVVTMISYHAFDTYSSQQSCVTITLLYHLWYASIHSSAWRYQILFIGITNKQFITIYWYIVLSTVVLCRD